MLGEIENTFIVPCPSPLDDYDPQSMMQPHEKYLVNSHSGKNHLLLPPMTPVGLHM